MANAAATQYLSSMTRPSVINVLSNALEPIGVVSAYGSLTLRPGFFTPGQFDFNVQGTRQMLDLLQEERIVEFETGGVLAGIIQGINKDITTRGVSLRVHGPLLGGLMERRLAVPSDDPELLGWDVAEGAVGAIMAHFVNDHAINPTVAARKIPLLRLAAGIETIGMLTVAKARFDVLADVLTSLGQYASVGWRIVIAGNALEFQALPLTERTDTSNAPLILSSAFRNIGTANTTDDTTKYSNTVYALGEGQYENRLRVVTYDGGETISGWARRETVADCGNEPSPARLQELGRQKISELRKTGSLTVALIHHSVGANLGDFVTIYLPEINEQYNLLITEMNIHWQGGRKSVDVTLGLPPRTLTSELQRTRRLSNIT